jgi:hypothetical protein
VTALVVAAELAGVGGCIVGHLDGDRGSVDFVGAGDPIASVAFVSRARGLGRSTGRAVDPTDCSQNPGWCREFFTLYQLMGVGKAPAVELRVLNADPGRSTLVQLAQIYCTVNDLDPDTLAAQVARAADGGEEALRHLVSLAYQTESNGPQTKSLAMINSQQRTTLREALTSPSGWLGLLAFMVSRSATDDKLSAMLIADVATMHPRAQRWAVFAACHLATDPIGVAQRFADADVGARTAAAGYLEKFGGTSEAAAELIGCFLTDADLRVQLAAGYQGPVDAVAKVWTCWSCLRENEIAAEDCTHCAHGSRPAASIVRSGTC